MTLVRRRSSTKERSARLVVRTMMRCRCGPRCDGQQRVEVVGQAGHGRGKLAGEGVDDPVGGRAGGVERGSVADRAARAP